MWATYCGPCKGELPYLEKIQEKLHKKEIVFVSIATDYDKKAWIQFLNQHQLKGIQLVMDRKWISFMHRYQVVTIPRYILLDREGKVIHPDMPRPSNPDFFKILKYLKGI
ncbi:alkyl hydroperoxide reductase/ Thiol specific antioxidant/ Mal allergen [gut metagenome]|uniref:Alkyl hydroperoxide reductase/ Thiol specific antioxidant/ Mal allergen n=1 Tax=gut metagenome TaxID=749906 RepID=J9H2U1_9ZZZZ